jgi:hypothetical protein
MLTIWASEMYPPELDEREPLVAGEDVSMTPATTAPPPTTAVSARR